MNVGAGNTNTSALDGTTAVFDHPGGIIQASSGLTLADSLDLTANAGTFNVRFFSTTLNGLISGSNNLTVTNSEATPGDLQLTADHTGFTGAVTITNRVQLNLNSGAKLSATTGITVDAGGTLVMNQADQINDAADVVLNGTFNMGGNEQIRTLSGTDAAAAINLGTNTLTTSTTANSSYAGAIAGAGNFVKEGTGTLTLGGANTHTGNTTINAGAITLLGTLNSDVTIGASGTLTTTANDQLNDSKALVVNGNLVLGGNEQVGTLSGTDSAAVTNLGVNSLTTTSNSNSSYAGTLVGTGGSLVKEGTGTLTLSGANTYTGATAINAGAITLNGSVTSNVTVGSSGTLFGTGTITGALVNNGNLRPGNSPGTLNLTGNFNNSSSGTLFVEIASLASFDKLLITGTATFGGTVDVSVTGGFIASEAGDAFTIITATGGVSGTFTTATLPAAYNASISYTATTVVITLSDVTYASSGSTPNQKSVAAALYTVRRNSPAGDASTVIGTLNGFSAATLRGALDQIASAPIEYDASMHSSIQGVSGITRTNLSERYSCLRTQQTGNNVSLTNLLNNRVTFSNQNLLASTDNRVLPQPTSTAQSPWGVFASGSAQRSDMETINQQAGYEFTSYGITTGVDYAFGPNFNAGAYLSYADSSNEIAQGLGTIDSNSLQAGLYAQWHDQQGLYFNANLGTGWTDFSNRRTIALFSRTATAKPQGQDYTASLSGGREFKKGAWTYGPIASVDYTRARIDGYTESGADFLNLSVDQSTQDSLQTTLGAMVSRQFKTRSAIFVPQGILAWQHEYKNQGQDVSARFGQAAVPASFSVRTEEVAADTLLTGFGLQCIIGSDLTIYSSYSANLLNTDYMTQSLTAGVHYSF